MIIKVRKYHISLFVLHPSLTSFFIPLYWRKVIALLTIRVTQYYLSYWTKMTLLDYNQCTPKEMGQRDELCFKKKVKREINEMKERGSLNDIGT